MRSGEPEVRAQFWLPLLCLMFRLGLVGRRRGPWAATRPLRLHEAESCSGVALVLAPAGVLVNLVPPNQGQNLDGGSE